MSTVGDPAASTSAGGPQTPLVLPPGTVIHMIAFAGHEEACEFVDEMVKHVNRHGHGIAHPTIVTTGDQFIRASQAQVPVMLVSAHGPGSETAEPVIGDGKGNRACLRSPRTDGTVRVRSARRDCLGCLLHRPASVQERTGPAFRAPGPRTSLQSTRSGGRTVCIWPRRSSTHCWPPAARPSRPPPSPQRPRTRPLPAA